MVVVDGTERHWPADLVLLSIGFEGTEPTVPRSFDIATQQNKIIANDKDYRTNKEKYLPLGMREESKSCSLGD